MYTKLTNTCYVQLTPKKKLQFIFAFCDMFISALPIFNLERRVVIFIEIHFSNLVTYYQYTVFHACRHTASYFYYKQ